jgi:hypothetical protein
MNPNLFPRQMPYGGNNMPMEVSPLFQPGAYPQQPQAWGVGPIPPAQPQPQPQPQIYPYYYGQR